MISITLLVCDDNDNDRHLTKEALERAHIANTVKFVADGAQLLDYLHQRGAYAGEIGLAPRPGLILIDLDMPTLDGREVLNVIRSDPSLCTIPIVVLTPPRPGSDLREALEPGATVFMEKPVTLTGLLEALQTLDRYWLDIVEPPSSTR
jgi:CheY-like chemotaxis protein